MYIFSIVNLYHSVKIALLIVFLKEMRCVLTDMGLVPAYIG